VFCTPHCGGAYMFMSVIFCVIAPACKVMAATRTAVRRVITASCVAWFCL